jgi:hypothetical protein
LGSGFNIALVRFNLQSIGTRSFPICTRQSVDRQSPIDNPISNQQSVDRQSAIVNSIGNRQSPIGNVD